MCILNKDLCKREVLRKDIQGVSFPFNKIALENGHLKVANSVALGVMLSLQPYLFKRKTILDVFKETFQREMLKQNIAAFTQGERLIQGSVCQSPYG